MAAPPDPLVRRGEILELRRIGAEELDPLLEEEVAEWNESLFWDFSSSAALVRKFSDSRTLGGFALLDRGEVAGYGYTVLEDEKGLIGDMFVREPWRGAGSETRLFRALLDSLTATPGVNRVESQLMLVEHPTAKALQRDRFIRLFERLLLTRDTTAPLPANASASLHRYYLEDWADHHRESAASVISLAYIGHIDARINDQYHSLEGARRFLHNIVEFPGCGVFYPRGSLVAYDRAAGTIAGMVLSSFVAEKVGHIAQICVAPRARHTGLGYELLRQAAIRLRQAGAVRITLTVTVANLEAVRLYERCGFQEVRRFHAYVWEGY